MNKENRREGKKGGGGAALCRKQAREQCQACQDQPVAARADSPHANHWTLSAGREEEDRKEVGKQTGH